MSIYIQAGIDYWWLDLVWLIQSPGLPGSSPAAADIFPWCTLIYAVTQAVQIRGRIMTAAAAADTATVAYD